MKKVIAVSVLLILVITVAIATNGGPQVSDRDERTKKAAGLALAKCDPLRSLGKPYGDCLETYMPAYANGVRDGKW